MKRALLVGAFLLLSLGAAQLLLPLSVPNTFQAGDNMSASAMNANLQAVYDRVAALHEAVSAAREAHADLRDRLDNLGPEAIEASAMNSGEFTSQQTGTLPWPFKAGDIVDADAVNESFAVLVAEASALQTELTGHHTDLLAFADTLAEVEQAHGLPSTPWPDTELQAYSDPAVTSFVKNQRAVPAELNANFASLVAAVEALEASSAALAAWAGNDVERVEAIEAAATPDLPSSAYQLRVNGTLNDGEFSEMTEFWYTTVSSTTPASRTVEWPDRNGFPVSVTGGFDFNIDARDLSIYPGALTPIDLVNLYLPLYDPSVSTRDFHLSNPNAAIHVVQWIGVYQLDPNGPSVNSHAVRFTYNEGPYPVAGNLVFSDRPVTVQGTMSTTESSVVREMDVTLAAGWNLVFPDSKPGEPPTLLYRASPITESNTVVIQDAEYLFGDSFEADSVAGYSLFAAHETIGDIEPTSVYSSWSTQTQSYLAVRGPAWVSHNRAPLLLVPIEDVDPTITPGQLTTDDPDARFLGGVLAAYDQVAVNSDLLGVYDARFADMELTSENGNYVLALYADRAVTMFADITVPDDPSQWVRTDPGGLQLVYGWNLLELVPDDPGSMLLTMRQYSGALPTVEFFELNP